MYLSSLLFVRIWHHVREREREREFRLTQMFSRKIKSKIMYRFKYRSSRSEKSPGIRSIFSTLFPQEKCSPVSLKFLWENNLFIHSIFSCIRENSFHLLNISSYISLWIEWNNVNTRWVITFILFEEIYWTNISKEQPFANRKAIMALQQIGLIRDIAYISVGNGAIYCGLW